MLSVVGRTNSSQSPWLHVYEFPVLAGWEPGTGWRADGKKKVTVSVDQYASASDAAAAYQTAVQGSKAAPGFNPAATPNLGQEAFAGTSQVGAEMHFGLGARDGRLIMSATHAGDIPVTPDNSNNLISLGGMELTTAKQVLGPSGSS